MRTLFKVFLVTLLTFISLLAFNSVATASEKDDYFNFLKKAIREDPTGNLAYSYLKRRKRVGPTLATDYAIKLPSKGCASVGMYVTTALDCINVYYQSEFLNQPSVGRLKRNLDGAIRGLKRYMNSSSCQAASELPKITRFIDDYIEVVSSTFEELRKGKEEKEKEVVAKKEKETGVKEELRGRGDIDKMFAKIETSRFSVRSKTIRTVLVRRYDFRDADALPYVAGNLAKWAKESPTKIDDNVFHPIMMEWIEANPQSSERTVRQLQKDYIDFYLNEHPAIGKEIATRKGLYQKYLELVDNSKPFPNNLLVLDELCSCIKM